MKLFNYNEKNYLFDPKAIRKIEELGLYSQDKADLEKRLYKDALEHYDEFIEEVAKLIHHLGFSSTIECSIMISFLIHNGFLSNEVSCLLWSDYGDNIGLFYIFYDLSCLFEE